MPLYLQFFLSLIVNKIGSTSIYLLAIKASYHQLFTVQNIFNYDLIWIIVPLLLILLVWLFFSFSKIKHKLQNHLLGSHNSEYFRNKEYQTYLLFFGILTPITEFTYEIFSLRPQSLLLSNVLIGVFLLTLYFISTKSTLVFQYIRPIFIVIYLLYFIFVCRNLINLPDDIIPTVAVVVILFFSYTVLKPVKLYWLFVAQESARRSQEPDPGRVRGPR